MVYIDIQRCDGCGRCVEVCPTDALRVINGLAHIEQNLCQGCEACVEACPRNAIVAVKKQAEVPSPVPVVAPTLAPTRPASSPWPLAGAVLAFVGREVVPRVVGVLLDTWDRKQSQAVSPASKVSAAGMGRMAAREKGARYRRRWRNKNR